MKLAIRKNVFGVLAFVGFVWAMYLVNLPLSPTRFDLNNYGVVPWTTRGLAGILLMPFLHDELPHLMANTVPLTVLLLMLAFTRPNARRILICLALLSGALLWGVGRNRVHLGSSTLVYALAAYLIAAGVYERKPHSAVIAILVGVLYGSLFWGLLPIAGEHVSWEGHLCGAVAGAGFAFLTLRKRTPVIPASQSAPLTESTPQPA
jgi:membrane associated rhomboid family serine protease